MGKSWEGWRWVQWKHKVLSMNGTLYVRTREGRRQMAREAELQLEALVGKREA